MPLRDTINEIIQENGRRLNVNANALVQTWMLALRTALGGQSGIMSDFARELVRQITSNVGANPTAWSIGIANRFRQWLAAQVAPYAQGRTTSDELRRAEDQARDKLGIGGGIVGYTIYGFTALAASAFSVANRYFSAVMGRQYQEYDRAYRPNLINEAPLMEAYRRGRVPESTVIDILERSGLPGEQIRITLDAQRPLLPPELIRELYLRGWMGEQARDDLLKQHGFTTAQVAQIVQAYPAMPGPQDLVSFSHREAFEPDQVRDLQLDTGFPEMYASSKHWWDAAGVTEELARLYWRVGWQIPSPNMLFEMYHRKAIGRPLLEAGLKAHDYQPMWNAPLLELSYTRPTLVDIRRMHAMGTITEPEMVTMLEKRGLSPDDARKVADFYVVYNRDVSTIGKVKPKQLTAEAIASSVDDGLIEAGDAESRLTLLGYTPEDAHILVGKVLYDRSRRLLKHRQAAVVGRLKSNRITEDEARAELATYQMKEDEIDAVVDLAVAEALVKGDPITEAQAKTAYEKGLLDPQAIREELLFRGYTLRRIDLLFRLWGEYGAKKEDEGTPDDNA